MLKRKKKLGRPVRKKKPEWQMTVKKKKTYLPKEKQAPTDGVRRKYNTYVKFFEKILKTNGPTLNTELQKLGKHYFGARNFKGVYSKDKRPSKSSMRGHQSYIFNLDNHNEPGSHWCSYYMSEDGTPCVYDSFGRVVLKGIDKRVRNSNRRAEQSKNEENCGQRCLAWLLCVYKLGIEKALTI